MSETPAPTPPPKRKFGVGSWLAVIALGAVLGAACWYMVQAWFMVPNEMTGNGYVAMILGIVFSVALGGGLMWLVFWSHRKGYDR